MPRETAQQRNERYAQEQLEAQARSQAEWYPRLVKAMAKAHKMGFDLQVHDSVDYTLTAKAGQTMSVKMTTTNASSYFNVLPPGSTGEAIFIGSSEGNNYSGVLPASGKYTVRVYLMRNAARRNETASYSVSFKITGK